jgi:hypothetical protein
MTFASPVLFVRRIKVVHKSQLGFCNLWRILSGVLIIFLWILLLSFQNRMVMMRSLPLLTGFLGLCVLFLCVLQPLLQMLVNCFLTIGYVGLVFLVRSFVIVMQSFSLHFGNLCVLSCRVELP